MKIEDEEESQTAGRGSPISHRDRGCQVSTLHPAREERVILLL
jgi:hypothetical protein